MNATASPTYIRSSAEFRRQIEFGETTESLVLEFKRDYGKRRTEKRKVVRNTQKELCRDIAQFANTWGGCLLIGVDEREDPGRNLRIADKIMGVDDPDSLRQWITQAAKNYLVPSTTSHDVTWITIKERVILAVNVPPSRHLVAIYDEENHTIEYLHRTSHGKAWMNPDEAERHLMDGSRAAKLALVEARNKALSRRPSTSPNSVDVVISGGIWATEGYAVSKTRPVRIQASGPIHLRSLKDTYFELRVPVNNHTVSTHVPYGVIEEAWMESQGRVALILSRRLRMIKPEDGFILEPWTAT